MLCKPKKHIAKHGMLILSVLVIAMICLYYCNQKSGFFLDELYSYGLSNSQDAPFITHTKDTIIDQTFTNQELQEYLTVNEHDSFDYASVYYNQSNDVHPPLYYFLIHTLSSIFKNSFSKWIGICINIPFFILTNVLIYLTVNKLVKNKEIALCGVILFGLNSLAISTLLMIRMYMMLTFLTILLPYVLIKLNENKKWYNYLFVGITILAGTLTQYYYIFYAFFLSAFYCLWLLRKRQFKNTLFFAIAASSGVLMAYLFFPYCIKQLLGNTAIAGTSALNNLKNFAEYPTRITSFCKFFVYNGIPSIFIAVTSLLLCLFNVKELRTKHKEKGVDLHGLIYIIPGVLTFLIVSIIAPYVAARYIYHLVPIFILAVCFLMNLAKRSFKIGAINRTAFMSVLLTISIVFALRVEPGFLYKHYKNHQDQISTFSEQPCVYISQNVNPPITHDLEQLLNFDKIYVTLSPYSEDLEDYLNLYTDYSNIVVHIASHPKSLNDEKLLLALCEKYKFKSYKQLYKRQFSTVYVLTNT